MLQPEENPDVERLMAEARTRASSKVETRELLVELCSAIAFLAVAVGMAVLVTPSRSLSIAQLAILAGSYVVACRVQFDVGAGYAVPTQLFFVPMLFLLPANVVPLVVSLSWLLGRLNEYASGDTKPARLWQVFGDSWHAVGPAAVLIVAGAEDPAFHHWPVYLLALACQFGVDLASSTIRGWLALGLRPALHGRLLAWVYMVDAALAPIGLLAAVVAVERPYTVAFLLPLLAILALLAQDRRRRIDNALELSKAYRGTALLLGDVVEADDAYTGDHSRGVVSLALSVADALGLDARQRRNVEFGALLHDVGKISVPKEIINKPGSLTPAEWAIMRQHTIEGERMLLTVGGVLADVGKVVRSSHEHYDGSGYPDGLVGEAIPIEARITSCCDAYSAMTTDRSYRSAMSVREAIAELRAHSGTQFDPAVATRLIEIVEQDQLAKSPELVAVSNTRPVCDSTSVIGL